MTKFCLLYRSKVNVNKMDTSNTRLFLNFLLDKNEKEAIPMLSNVKDEIEIALKHSNLSSNAQKILEELNGIVVCLEGKSWKSAFIRAEGVNKKFTDSIEIKLKSASRNSQQPDPRVQPSQAQSNQDFSKSQRLREGHGQNNQDLSKTPYARRDPGQQNNYNMNGQNAGTYPEMHANRVRIEPVNPEADLEYRSRMAGQRMRHNNPDIADLSDVNRPTKVAERFSELYDNEWTEAFEALVKSMKDEQRVIQLLLDIVETAYMFCKKEAEQQIDDMRQKILQILTGGMVKNPQTVPGSDTLLIQFRKSIANTAVDRVVQEFRARKLPEIFKAWGKGLPTKGGPVDLYTCKSVELTWWMCVQDPPIYMCMHDERIEPSTYPTLYKAYTRSGKIKDYSVWPALKLHQGGGVLVKGVMQFK